MANGYPPASDDERDDEGDDTPETPLDEPPPTPVQDPPPQPDPEGPYAVRAEGPGTDILTEEKSREYRRTQGTARLRIDVTREAARDRQQGRPCRARKGNGS